MIGLMDILKIYLEQQLLIEYYMTKPKYDGFQRGLASIIFKFFNNKSASLPDKFVSAGANTWIGGVKSEIIHNQRSSNLAEELDQPITR